MRLTSLFIAFTFITACSSMVNIDYDRSVNFKSFTTFSLQAKPIHTDDDTRVTTPFMQERIVSAISDELIRKGFKRKESKTDLNVKYHVDVVRDFETEGSSVSFGFGTGGGHTSIGMGFVVPVGETYTVDRMVLTIDMYSVKTQKLVWRGSLAYRLEMGATPESYTYMANRLVSEILKDFPPR